MSAITAIALPAQTLTTLYTFDCTESGCPNGGYPYGVLIQAANGDLYGTTSFGGANGGGTIFKITPAGTIFRLSAGLRPFVTTLRASGTAGAQIKILGTDLTGATSVTFNGAAAAFAVVSHTEIGTTVPAGATSGEVQVVTPGITLSSNVPFRVQP